MSELSEIELSEWVSRISERFYEKVYEDSWFSKLFRNIDQEIITSQQAAFMLGNLGGPRLFAGRMPKDAHPQIWIDEDIWQYREDLLRQTFDELNVPVSLVNKWLKIDEAFKSGIINSGGPDECEGRYKTDEIIFEPMPNHLKKPKAA